MTLHWCVMLLCQYGDAQEKVFEEVDRVVGRERFPKLEDRINLPYTSAALCEVMRFSSILPLSVPHATSKEVKLGKCYHFCFSTIMFVPLNFHFQICCTEKKFIELKSIDIMSCLSCLLGLKMDTHSQKVRGFSLISFPCTMMTLFGTNHEYSDQVCMLRPIS